MSRRGRFTFATTGLIIPAARARVAMVITSLVVVVLCSLVYGSRIAAATLDVNAIPVHVAETRDAILAAVKSANLDDLTGIIDAQDTKPDFGIETGNDPIAALKKLSADGGGREILAAMAEVLDVAPATLPLGKDLENNLIYVWPYLAEKPLEQLNGAEQIDLFRLVPAAKVVEMREKKRWLWWRLAISADGSWLMFKKID